MKEILASIGQAVAAPFYNILGFVGGVLVIVAFIEYDKTQGFTLHGQPGLARIIIGGTFLILAIIAFIIEKKDMRFHSKLNYKKGVIIKRDELTITIKESEIQNICDASCNAAFVLPMNTTFADDCAADDRTALGAFFIKHFPGEVALLPQCFKSVLDASGIMPTGNGQYLPGTTILLPDKFARPASVLITASTARTPAGDISSNPHIICNCVEEIFRRTSNNQIDTINIPILGSGHGGIDKGLALLFLLLAILHFSKTFHHLKTVNIIVHPKDIDTLNRSKELRAVLAL